MPIENERKFVLLDDGRLEQQLAHVPGVTKSFLRQAYLDVSGMRIRSLEADGRKRYVFTYKREVDGQVVEIETEISPVDFERLWSQRRETLQKMRYSWTDGPFHWDVDFFKADDNRTYFTQAEVEMPEDQTEPPPLPSGFSEPMTMYQSSSSFQTCGSRKHGPKPGGGAAIRGLPGCFSHVIRSSLVARHCTCVNG